MINVYINPVLLGYFNRVVRFQSLNRKIFQYVKVMIFCLFLTSGNALAVSSQLEATFSSGIANNWSKVERWNDPNSAFTQEAFPPDGRGDQTGQRVSVTFLNIGVRTISYRGQNNVK